MQFWNELEGRNIDGRYPLVRLMRSEGRSAWFESVAGDPAGSPATISLIEALTDADDVMDRLQAAQSLQHPNLVGISKVGQVTLDDTLFVYAVMAHIEQSLADVLQMQSLSPEEGREVAEALVAALTVIHQKGMSHGHVEAASVLATEQAVQLRSDCLQLSAAGQADDVAGIGVTLFHAFTQRKALSATDAQINHIPAPFAEIVRNTFGRRWTLAQVANALKPAPVVAPAAVFVAPAVAAAPVAPATPAPPPRPAETPVARLEPLPPQSETFEQAPEAVAAGTQRKPYGLYGGVALVVLALLAWLFLRPHSAPAPTPETTPQAAAAAPPVVVPAPPAKPPAAPSHADVGRPAKTPPAVAAGTTRAVTGHSIWRVIAYTYRNEKPAQEMVEKLKAQHPNLNVAVFSLGSGKSPYLISLGGAMTHEDALKMLDKARAMGLPADTFVRNFSE